MVGIKISAQKWPKEKKQFNWLPCVATAETDFATTPHSKLFVKFFIDSYFSLIFLLQTVQISWCLALQAPRCIPQLPRLQKNHLLTHKLGMLLKKVFLCNSMLNEMLISVKIAECCQRSWRGLSTNQAMDCIIFRWYFIDLSHAVDDANRYYVQGHIHSSVPKMVDMKVSKLFLTNFWDLPLICFAERTSEEDICFEQS